MNMMMITRLALALFLVLLPLPLPPMVSAQTQTQTQTQTRCIIRHDDAYDDANAKEFNESLRYRIAAIFSILFAGGIGVSIPHLGKRLEALNPDKDLFFMVKAFAAGVILATGFIHILPAAFKHLDSPCLPHNPWGKFPFAGLLAMASAVATLMVDTFATAFYQNQHFNTQNQNQNQKPRQVADLDLDLETDDHAGHIHVHAHATDGHSHGSLPSPSSDESKLIRHRIISQVLELGIIVHSVIIGLSLGASQSVSTIKPLLAALSFHQFFEGMGLGGCISQAKFESLSTVIMTVFFSLTTPLGIAIGIGLSCSYKENSPTALVVEGLLTSASAGILVYMALVDLLAADFMNPRMQSNLRLQLGANVSLLLGAGCMSLLAIWA